MSGGSQIYTRARCALRTPPIGKIFILKRILGPVEMCAKFQLYSSSSFQDIRGPKFTLGALRPPAHSLAGKCSYMKRVLGPM